MRDVLSPGRPAAPQPGLPANFGRKPPYWSRRGAVPKRRFEKRGGQPVRSVVGPLPKTHPGAAATRMALRCGAVSRGRWLPRTQGRGHRVSCREEAPWAGRSPASRGAGGTGPTCSRRCSLPATTGGALSAHCSPTSDAATDDPRLGETVIASNTTWTSPNTPTGSSPWVPGADEHGGRVVFAGTPAERVEGSHTTTARWLRSDGPQVRVVHG